VNELSPRGLPVEPPFTGEDEIGPQHRIVEAYHI
jgi:hypothetical protein